MKRHTIVLWGVALLGLGLTNALIVQKEMLVSNGQRIFLELAPRDPRSLVQGDYMALRYAIARNVRPAAADGYLVIKVDEENIARFERIYTPQTPLAQDELLLRYRRRGGNIFLGAESFFFQEGQAGYYSNARYAELRVAESGESVLVGLRGPQLEVLGPPLGETY